MALHGLLGKLDVVGPPGFEEFWRVYPRLTAKGRAMRAYRQALKIAPAEKINWGAQKFADFHRSAKTPVGYIPYPATWLNDLGWQEFEYSLPRTGKEKNREVVGKVYLDFIEREAWDKYGLSIGKTYQRDSRGGWFFDSRWPPNMNADGAGT